MHQRLFNKYSLVVSRKTVRKAISALDPDGVRQRSLRRFRRRTYVTRGPNDIWHIDGHDKLNPFIDGYSRRILWLEVEQSNNDPEVVPCRLRQNNRWYILPNSLRLWDEKL